ncbi:MAG: 5-methyltetrahydropteroyltriglutamate--homocysteine S-methyltransferase, partial [Solirubrobacterales bacterium]|nr:5-methyltetrahydropteroyltriglutamate--homocysteine S-methyltransferase [Solirubrobacterales bacterium]
MARTAVLGFPRIGANRELKLALEEHWSGASTFDELQGVARRLRDANLDSAEAAGIDVVPVGDFALYDHVLDAAGMAGVVAERHSDGEDRFLACRGAEGVAPLEMTKWFDTNYHYLVPELRPGQRFALDCGKWLEHLAEAEGRAARPRPVVIGPLSLLLLAKGVPDPLALLPGLTEVYAELLRRLHGAGAEEVQLDEPCLALDRSPAELDAFASAYAELTRADIPICLATYFAGLDAGALARIGGLPLGELHVDLTRAPEQLDSVLAALPDGARLSAGVVDGRNVWATDMDAALERLDSAAAVIGSERLTIAPSCSLLHVPYRAAREHGLDPDLRRWLAFGEEKLGELAVLRQALDGNRDRRDELLAPMRAAIASRRSSA